MKTKFQPCLATLLIGAASAMLVGCSSMRVLSSAPPAKSFVLEKPVELTFDLGGELSLPAGEYKPVMEDKDGYYYQAPSKIDTRDLFFGVADGGLYLRRGDQAPSRWYAIDDQNYTRTGKLPWDFKFKATE